MYVCPLNWVEMVVEYIDRHMGICGEKLNPLVEQSADIFQICACLNRLKIDPVVFKVLSVVITGA